MKTELEERYGFFGGLHLESMAYLNRSNLPQDMWHFLKSSETKARSGVSVMAGEAWSRVGASS